MSSTKEFNWDDFGTKGFGEGYSKEQRAQMEAMYAGTLSEITEKEVIKGVVVGVNDKDVIINIGFKSDGLVPLSEFRDVAGIKVGDEVDVFIEEQENALGQLILSRKKAKIVRAWHDIEAALENDSVIEGLVKRRTKGGLIVDIYGVEAFLPGSQIDVKPIRDFDVYVGKKMEVKVVKINQTNDNSIAFPAKKPKSRFTYSVHVLPVLKSSSIRKSGSFNNFSAVSCIPKEVRNFANFSIFLVLFSEYNSL